MSTAILLRREHMDDETHVLFAFTKAPTEGSEVLYVSFTSLQGISMPKANTASPLMYWSDKKGQPNQLGR